MNKNNKANQKEYNSINNSNYEDINDDENSVTSEDLNKLIIFTGFLIKIKKI